MIKIENVEVLGWEHAIRGMRNPKNSWEKSDSELKNFSIIEQGEVYPDEFVIGPNDHKLMMSLAKGGPVHAKYRRMITVYLDITAPLYWWKEFDTYKIGVTANSCSTMHKIHAKEFEVGDFSCEHLYGFNTPSSYVPAKDCFPVEEHDEETRLWCSDDALQLIIDALNFYRERFLKTKDKKYWWQMIQLLPTSYNQKRTIMLNYEVLHNMYISRKDHKLDEWREFCKWIESLPYSEIIIGGKEE